MVIFSEITEKQYVRERYATRQRKFDVCNIARSSQLFRCMLSVHMELIILLPFPYTA